MINEVAIKNAVVTSLEEVKGDDIRVLDIHELSDMATFMVIASGNTDRHVRAMTRQVTDDLRDLGERPLGTEGETQGEWVLLDYGEVIVHLMQQQTRDFYDLEKLWDEDLRPMIEKQRQQTSALT
ncbi:MAG TPA: ribosome silencing factor [Gammaproteobacteria bacterium]|nr:ribosome silencing factor [Gammaproteobacteria bacterium]